MRLPVLCVAALSVAGCQAAPRSAAPILPLRTVRLYETGVGYFERSGRAAAGTGLPLPAGHLDDALKTLVILGDGAVQGVEFKSSVSKGMARALAGLPTVGDGDGDGAISYRDLLGALKGAVVEARVRSGAVVRGRLLDVQAPPVDEKADKGREPELTLLLLTERAEVRRLRAAEVQSLRPTDPLLQGRLSSSLEALSGRGAQAGRLLRLLSRAEGPVTLGYVAEAPVWRTTYRLVFGTKGGAVLQGWALLHNDTDEDWRGVKVSLVNGRPDSFLYPLAAPRYARRELQHPADDLSTVPQLLDTTVDSLWGDRVGESYGMGGLGTVGHGAGGGGSGRGSIGVGRSGGEGSSTLLSVGNLAQAAQAVGVEAGALFSYALGEDLSLPSHGTALVPFLQESVDAGLITWVDGPGGAARSAVRLRNSGRQTLPAGPISIFVEGGFAGEALVDRMKPGERRFLQYGTDMDVEVVAVKTQAREEIKRLSWKRDTLQVHFLRHVEQQLKMKVRGGQGRSVYLGLRLGNNAQVTGADRVDYDLSAGVPAAVFAVNAGSEVERALKTVEGRERETGFSDLTAAKLQELSGNGDLPAGDRGIAGEAAARQREVEVERGIVEKLRAEETKVEADLGRLREHLKAQGGGAGAAGSPFVKRILEGEDRLTGLRGRIAAEEAAIQVKREAVKAALSKLAAG